MRFEEPTKWELFLDGFHDFMYALDCYISGDHREFWEALSSGWYDDYIYPYDDAFYIHVPSPERKLRLNEKPPTIYLSAEDFDSLVKRLELPSEETMESIKRLMNRKTPWDDNDE